jgi:phospholipid/cholesterol/gamma-HCH transport system substrate-binding protein
MVARVAAFAALVAAVVLVVLLILANGSNYTLRLRFQDAGGLVPGNDVLIGPARVGSVNSISLTPDGLAQVVIGLHNDVKPMHVGTIARVYENSLSGIANKYVVLQPGPQSAPAYPSGSVITEDHTYSAVSLDQLFNALTPATRTGLQNVIRGEAKSLIGKGRQANLTLKYLAPGLESTSNVTRELAADEPAFDGLLVNGAKALSALATRTAELTQLVQNTNVTTGAIASQSTALSTALGLLPPALRSSTVTFAGLDRTLDALDPLVAASKPAVRRLAPFSAALHKFTVVSTPTLNALVGLIANPSGGGDLTQLFQQTPALLSTANATFPNLITAMNKSQAQLDYLREYTPDVVASLADLGQAGAYYDANGHYTRTQPYFSAFTIGAGNQLQPLPAFETRYSNLQVVHGRCPGGAVQPAPDGSAPHAVPGCNPSSTPPGP